MWCWGASGITSSVQGKPEELSLELESCCAYKACALPLPPLSYNPSSASKFLKRRLLKSTITMKVTGICGESFSSVIREKR